MVKICFYFQVHQPIRMKKYSVFDIGNNHKYFDDKKNIEVLYKIARKCYLPTNKLMLELLEKHPEFKIAYSLSGVFLEQCEKHCPQIIESFKKLINTGRVEILAETYHHSLSYIYSKEEFKEQIELHKQKVQKLFGITPTVFRNTELIYNNELAKFIEELGFKGILAEGWDHYLKWRNANFLYKPKTTTQIKVLLKNYKLSDDIAFRFSNKGWAEWPLTAEKFAQWISKVNGNGECVNLFMDYETFGEHQWEDTGIFEFLKKLPEELLKHPDNKFATPSELVDELDVKDELDVHNFMSWADMERDLSAWLGNQMQQSAIKRLYLLESDLKKLNNPELLDAWRKLQTSDHFYYMCTKWFSDGDVHKYFNPYDSPYDSFIIFMNIINDLILQMKEEAKVKSIHISATTNTEVKKDESEVC